MTSAFSRVRGNIVAVRCAGTPFPVAFTLLPSCLCRRTAPCGKRQSYTVFVKPPERATDDSSTSRACRAAGQQRNLSPLVK